ncbi:MAG: hypothetical protein ACYTEL_13120 [Planctomycetota bacterium]|jgi:hypothetical protein
MFERKVVVAAGAAVAVLILAVIIIVGRSGDSEPAGEPSPLTVSETDSGVEPCQPQPAEYERIERTRAEAEKSKELEEQQDITIVITDYPAGVAQGSLFAIYSDGVSRRQSGERESPGQIILAGPSKLGGELAVYIRRRGRQLMVWAYMKNLGKKQINLPGDADMVVTAQDLADVSLSFDEQDKELLKNWSAVAFYNSADSQVPLFVASMSAGPDQVVDHSKVPLEIVPGRYHARAIVNKDGQETHVALGMMDVGAGEATTYPVEVPYK